MEVVQKKNFFSYFFVKVALDITSKNIIVVYFMWKRTQITIRARSFPAHHLDKKLPIKFN